jgi:tetratricopeptide (TPR) repeat protein
MPAEPDSIDADALAARADAAFAQGDLAAARRDFDALAAQAPDDAHSARMQAAVRKYLRDWAGSLERSLHALSLEAAAEPHDAVAPSNASSNARWNAGIAATALGDWAEARRQWAACGIALPPGDGPIAEHFGVAALRLEPWGRAATVFARRIDPVRAQLIGVPPPECGYRYGDILLHDCVPLGERRFLQSRVPVYAALQRLIVSEYPGFAATVVCGAQADLDALLAMRVPGIAYAEDWTAAEAYGDAAHQRMRHRIGIAAQSRRSVLRLIERWREDGDGRFCEGIEGGEHALVDPPERGNAWWRVVEP